MRALLCMVVWALLLLPALAADVSPIPVRKAQPMVVYTRNAAAAHNYDGWQPVMDTPPTIAASGSSGITGTTFNGGTVSSSEVPTTYSFLGATWVRGSGFPDGQVQFATGLTGSNLVPHGAIEFVTDALEFEYIFKHPGASPHYRIWVDGQLATLNGYTPGGSAGNYPRYEKVTFGSAVSRLIRFESYLLPPNGIRVATGKVVTPSTVTRPRCIVIGDSFTEPSGSTIKMRGFASLLGLKFGWDTWACGAGSTGYLNDGTAGRVNFRKRVHLDVIPYRPDIVIVAGGINDSGFSAGAVEAEAKALFDSIQRGCVGAKVIAVGPFFPTTAYSNVTNSRLGIMAAARARGIPFIDPTNPEAPWITDANQLTYHSNTAAAGTTLLVADVVDEVIITNESHYSPAQTPTVSFSGGGGTGAAGTAVMDGRVTSISMLSGGNGYTVAPDVEITTAAGDVTGESATATATVSGGKITGVTVTDAGTGYTRQPIISFSGGNGTGAAAVAGYNWVVASVTITNGGSGYVSPPAVAFTAPNDATHPGNAGHGYYAERIAHEILNNIK